MGTLKESGRGNHSSSILTGKAKMCYVTGRTDGLDKHHIFHGSGLRQISDKYGFWCYIRHELHIAGLGGLHKYPNSGLDLQLKRDCQRKFEETHSREEFMALIGRNYLGDCEVEQKQPEPEGGFYLLEEGESV